MIQIYQMNLSQAGEGRNQACKSANLGKRGKYDHDQKQKAKRWKDISSWLFFLRGKRTPSSENSDRLSQRCKEDIVHVNEAIIEECQNVEGHKRVAHLSE